MPVAPNHSSNRICSHNRQDTKFRHCNRTNSSSYVNSRRSGNSNKDKWNYISSERNYSVSSNSSRLSTTSWRHNIDSKLSVSNNRVSNFSVGSSSNNSKNSNNSYNNSERKNDGKHWPLSYLQLLWGLVRQVETHTEMRALTGWSNYRSYFALLQGVHSNYPNLRVGTTSLPTPSCRSAKMPS